MSDAGDVVSYVVDGKLYVGNPTTITHRIVASYDITSDVAPSCPVMGSLWFILVFLRTLLQ